MKINLLKLQFLNRVIIIIYSVFLPRLGDHSRFWGSCYKDL